MERSRVMRRRLWFGVAIGGLVLGCRDEGAELRSAAPAVSTVVPGVCASVAEFDSASIGLSVPVRTTGFCIDPHNELRSYGESSMRDLDEGCERTLAGSCDGYRRLGLRQIWTWRYVEDRGSAKAVSVHALRFGGREGSYAVFTQRVSREREVASSLQALEARGEAVLAGGVAQLWRGPYVVELRYQDEKQAPAGVHRAAAATLPPLVQDIAAHLEGRTEPPEAVRRLPVSERVPQGVTFTPRDAFGVAGLGAAAVGDYRREGQPYRILIAVRRDAERLDDLIHSLRRLSGYRKLKAMPYRAFQLHRASAPDEPRVEWLVGSSGQRLVAVGNVRATGSAGSPSKLALSERDKLELLRSILTEP